LKRFFIFFITISKEKKIIVKLSVHLGFEPGIHRACSTWTMRRKIDLLVREVFMHTEPKIKVQLGPVLEIAVSLKFDKVWKRDTNFKKDAGV